jgi:uncharacterized membrane protein
MELIWILKFIVIVAIFLFLLAFLGKFEPLAQPHTTVAFVFPFLPFEKLKFKLLKLKMNKKGAIEIRLLVTIALLCIIVLIIFLLWQNFSSGAGKTASGSFYSFLDRIFSIFGRGRSGGG